MHASLLVPSPNRVYAVILDVGDEIVEALTTFSTEAGIDAASFTAIGAVSEAILGFFDLQLRDYRHIPVPGQAEIVSLVGDVTRNASEMPGPTVHGHMVIARSDGSTVGGHLLRALVRPTLEVVLTETPAHLRRSYDPALGLALIDLEQHDPSGLVFVGGGDGPDRS